MKMACIHVHIYHCTDDSTTGGEKTEEIDFEGYMYPVKASQNKHATCPRGK